jgi:RimJ/RimL family protein N-acetyltransferase
MHLPRTLTTPRLLLRDPRPADAPALFAGVFSDPAVLRYLGLRPHATERETQQQISFDIHRWLKGSAWPWVITRPAPGRPEGTAIGLIDLTPMSQPAAQSHHLRLGFMLARAQWQQGLMSEALHAVIAAALAQASVWRVDALCDVDNAASAALLARAGLQREGCLRRALIHPNAASEPRDAWVFSAVRGAWPPPEATPT